MAAPAPAPAPAPTFPAFTGFAFGAAAAPAPAPAAAAAAAAAPASSSGSDASSKPAAGGGFNWGVPGLTLPTAAGTGQAAPAFSFGGATAAAPAATSAASAPFSFTGTLGGFGKPPAAAAPFTFGAPAAAAATGAGGGGEDGDDGGGDDEGEPILEPEKVLRNPDDKDEKVIECASKLWRFDTGKGEGGGGGGGKGEWIDVGKGTFSITKCAETGKQRMLIRNSVGKVRPALSPFSLPPSLPVSPTKKTLLQPPSDRLQRGVFQGDEGGEDAERDAHLWGRGGHIGRAEELHAQGERHRRARGARGDASGHRGAAMNAA